MVLNQHIQKIWEGCEGGGQGAVWTVNGDFQEVLEEPLEVPEDWEKSSTMPMLQGGEQDTQGLKGLRLGRENKGV